MSHSCDPKLHLFVSLGTSPAIVPEAFLFPDVTFKAVHVLTTERPQVDLIQKFFRDKPTCLTISRVKCFTDFETEKDHFRFEEVLYRWLLLSDTRPEERYICLTGGFKTMSSAMQKAAEILGAAEVFHVLATGEQPSTIKEIKKAKEDERLRWIRLGAEQGWPQFHQASSSDYPLIENKTCNGVKWLSAPDQKFRKWHKEIIERSHRIASSWEELPSFPFAELATWPKRSLDWLNSPLDHKKDKQWIKALPKIELHCHLGGFATLGKQLDEVRAKADEKIPAKLKLDSRIPKKWPLPKHPIGLEQYRSLGDNNGSLILCDPGCLKKQCKLLYDHLCEQNIVYAEIRCSPANYVAEELGRSPWDVLVDIRETFQSCMKDGKCHINLIIIGTRQSGGDYRAGISRHLSLAITATEHWTDENSCRVVGVDLAGYEDETTRAHYFREEFTAIHHCGLALTVHAGENDDAEGIWRAIFDLNARRLGHALNLLESKETLHSVVNRGIGIEMCPYANFQIHGYPLEEKESEKTYPLSKYLKEGVRVTVNTDNIGISGASLSDNLILTARLCPGLTRLDILRLQRNALDEAFVSPNLREELLKKCRQKFALRKQCDEYF